jgi:uncharacterized protein YjbJ (UPF0337 family)
MGRASAPSFCGKDMAVMNWDTAEQDWAEFKAEVRANWNRLTSEQLEVISGSRIQLAGEIQQAYGITSDAAELQIRRFEDCNRVPRTVSSR